MRLSFLIACCVVCVEALGQSQVEFSGSEIECLSGKSGDSIDSIILNDDSELAMLAHQAVFNRTKARRYFLFGVGCFTLATVGNVYFSSNGNLSQRGILLVIFGVGATYSVGLMALTAAGWLQIKSCHLRKKFIVLLRSTNTLELIPSDGGG